MSPVILFIFLACSCASLVYGVENDTKISVCDTNAYYACGCDEVFKVTTDEFVVNVRCSLISLTAINPDMLLPKFIDVLDLSGNDIEEVAYNGVLVSSTMSILYLNRNKINKIVPGSFQDLPSLRKLDLSENYIESIEQNVFQGIYKLEYLYLNSNKLKSLPTNVFQSLPRLDILVLNHNNLGESLANITDIFSKEGLSLNPNLRYLYLKYINLTNLHDHYFDSAYNLRDLQLSGNPITSFSQLPYTLEVLDISDTNISSLGPRDFVNLPALKELYLNDLYNLTEISNHTFHPLKGLIKIELKNCKNLKYFSPYAFGVNAAVEGNDEYAFPVLTLDLMGSGLRTLDERLMPLFSRLTVLDIRMNPWNCDCKLKWLLQLNIKESDKAAISCNKPPNFQGRQLWSLEPADLDCKSWSVTISGLTRVTLVFLCVALAALALWLVTLWAPSYVPRPPHAPGPDSPYSRITITPNTAQD